MLFFFFFLQVQLFGGGDREWKSSNQQDRRRGVCAFETPSLPDSDIVADTELKRDEPMSSTRGLSSDRRVPPLFNPAYYADSTVAISLLCNTHWQQAEVLPTIRR